MEHARKYFLLLFQPKIALMVLLGVSVFALGAAFTAEYVFDLKPCLLCIYQRVPYAVVIAVTGLALALKASDKPLFFVLLFLSQVFFAGVLVGAYQIGVEQQWWEATESCKAASNPESFDEIKAQIMGTALADCRYPEWSLFGLTFAGYNTILSLFLEVYTILVAVLFAKRERLFKNLQAEGQAKDVDEVS
jgi:disulfide bond formation protein DsbB